MEAYLKTIGYGGLRDVTTDTLKALQAAHARTIPLENLGFMCGEKVLHCPLAVCRRIVLGGRGGASPELNGAYCWLLQQLGFQATLVACELYNHQSSSFLPEGSHIAVLVGLGRKRFLTDISCPTFSKEPMVIVPHKVQTDAVGSRHRLRRHDEMTWSFQKMFFTRFEGPLFEECDIAPDPNPPWTTVYRFSLIPIVLEDFKHLTNVFYQNFKSPKGEKLFSPKKDPLVMRHTTRGRKFLLGKRFCTLVYKEGVARKTVTDIDTSEEMADVIWREFGIRMVDEKQLMPRIDLLYDQKVRRSSI
ncbi:arylamine N-acetyltransferase 2-like [Branchiostoma lanceolatum]|uniref:arylamine N-acetyltransferase 2-like n=1 Tax=Branchiostoma lanceolatum TaxID=7740 RepID=UPI003455C761